MHEDPDPLRLELAAVAARLVADGGHDYASAKKKALRQVLGDNPAPKRSVPDNDEIDAALREHLELFDPGHVPRVAQRRRTAAALMQRLQAFHPYLTGAVWKGIVTEHAPIHLQLFHDNPKDVEIQLLNDGVDFDVSTVPHFRGGTEVEAIAFYVDDAPVLLSLYEHDDLRGALRRGAAGPERGDRQAVLERLAEAA
ncbi:MAG TPA: UDP-N-acetylmuramate--alanine ligase [Zeimonas sp.]|nr:UDP-N-acetylmuramate--alanine ligase [Zeimonas sp.]